MKLKTFKLRHFGLAVLLAGAPLLATADVSPPALVLGETIIVAGITDAAPTACTNIGTITCANLRSAIARANANGNEATAYDRIVLANGSVHTLSMADGGLAEANDASNNSVGDLDLTTPMHIETANGTLGRATIQGIVGFNDRLLHINAAVKLDNLILTKGQGVFMNGGAIYVGDTGNATITNCLITDNFASWDLQNGTGDVQGSGGGIYSKGVLTVSRSTLSKNTAKTLRNGGLLEVDRIGSGGAIYASQATTLVDSIIGGLGAGNVAVNGAGLQMAGGSKLEILRTTMSHNDAVSGGAINVVSPAASPFTITNSTISTNHATDSGAGINTSSSVSILNSTIADNVKVTSNQGAGLNLAGGTASLKNTLLAHNLGGGVSANCGKVGSGVLPVLTQGGNLSTDGTCNLTYSTDQQNVADAKIGPLALNDNTLNGAFTHALLDGSPAIDKGVNDGCPSSDERGFIRPFDALVLGTKVCDIGAYERFIDRQDLAITGVTADPERMLVGSSSTVTVHVANTAATAATGVTLKTTLPSGVTYVGFACTAAGDLVNCAVGTLLAGATADVAMELKVASAGANVVTSELSAASADPVPGNNTSSVTLVGLTAADLNLTASGVSFVTGGQGQVTYTLLNQGSGDARNLVVTGAVPDGLSLVSASGGVCTINGAAFSCDVPEVLANQSKAIVVTLSSDKVGTYSVTAQVTGDVVDGDGTDNAATASVTVAGSTSGGGGCALASGKMPFDPVLPTLAALGLIGLGLRRYRRD
ncbi:MAG: choice-of-anchor Q domain-containing protein [Thiobacillus sp.]